MANILHDPDRLAVLRELAILDTPSEPAYDDIARLAAISCRRPVAAVNFVDESRHWAKAVFGASARGSSVDADKSFCAATVTTEQGMLVLPDTSALEAWQSHPFVVGPPFVRSYAGAAVYVSGEPVGVVCSYGDAPGAFAEGELDALRTLARLTSGQLELRRRNEALRDLALTDPLTGLANRALLLDRLEVAISESRRDGLGVGLLFCDVDDLKGTNDRLGHEAGDRLLRDAARRLEEAARDVDTVARYAGDEFVLVCPRLTSDEELARLAERIDLQINRGEPPEGGECGLGLTIGAVLVEDDETAAGALRRADEAMYARKAARRLPAS